MSIRCRILELANGSVSEPRVSPGATDKLLALADEVIE
jgi:hypothetical protein